MSSLREVQTLLRKWHSSGSSWRVIGAELGINQGTLHRIAYDDLNPKEEAVNSLMDSLPSYLKESTEELEKRVWEIVRSRPGPENAIPQKEVAKMVGVPVRRVRIITLALLGSGYPVATTTRPPYGVYRMTTEAHREAYARQLWSRVNKVMDRAQLVGALDLGDGKVKQMGMFG